MWKCCERLRSWKKIAYWRETGCCECIGIYGRMLDADQYATDRSEQRVRSHQRCTSRYVPYRTLDAVQCKTNRIKHRVHSHSPRNNDRFVSQPLTTLAYQDYPLLFNYSTYELSILLAFLVLYLFSLVPALSHLSPVFSANPSC